MANEYVISPASLIGLILKDKISISEDKLG